MGRGVARRGPVRGPVDRRRLLRRRGRAAVHRRRLAADRGRRRDHARGLREARRPHEGPREVRRRVDLLRRARERDHGPPAGQGGGGDRDPRREVGRAAARVRRARGRRGARAPTTSARSSTAASPSGGSPSPTSSSTRSRRRPSASSRRRRCASSSPRSRPSGHLAGGAPARGAQPRHAAGGAALRRHAGRPALPADPLRHPGRRPRRVAAARSAGASTRPLSLSLDDLRARPAVTRAGDDGVRRQRPRAARAAAAQPAVAARGGRAPAEWTGVAAGAAARRGRRRGRRGRGALHRPRPRRRGRRRAGLRSAACRSPRRFATDVLLAYEINGAPLPPQHGFPLRLRRAGLVRDDEREVARGGSTRPRRAVRAATSRRRGYRLRAARGRARRRR